MEINVFETMIPPHLYCIWEQFAKYFVFQIILETLQRILLLLIVRGVNTSKGWALFNLK